MFSDPIESATKGVLDWTKDEAKKILKDLIKRFRNRKLAFIEDIETINIAKEMRKKSEWLIFSQYIQDKRLRILFQMGLTLREQEKNKQEKSLRKLQAKIRNKYDREGLQIAHFVQNSLFSKYVGIVLDRELTPQMLSHKIGSLFRNINTTVSYVEKTDNIKNRASEIIAKIQANSPETFIISSSHKLAMDRCKSIENIVMGKVSQDYNSELFKSVTKNRRIYFITRKELIE